MCPYRPWDDLSEFPGISAGHRGCRLAARLQGGSADRAFVETRIAEIRALLDTPALAHAEGVTASPGTISAADVYQAWAPHYDAPGNQMIDIEQPVVRRILDGLPVGTALDAACGTGRHTAYLRELGHDVIGVDASPEMLAQARKRLPDVAFHEADLHRIPLPDDAVDTVVCALALAHVPDLAPVLAEFARVLRPGGNLVISDAHLLVSYLRPTLARRPGPDGRPSLLAEYHRPLSAYLAAALPWASRSGTARNPTARATPSTPTPPRTHSRPTCPGTCCTGARKRRLRPWTIPRSWSSGTSNSTAPGRAELVRQGVGRVLGGAAGVRIARRHEHGQREGGTPAQGCRPLSCSGAAAVSLRVGVTGNGSGVFGGLLEPPVPLTSDRSTDDHSPPKKKPPAPPPAWPPGSGTASS